MWHGGKGAGVVRNKSGRKKWYEHIFLAGFIETRQSFNLLEVFVTANLVVIASIGFYCRV